MLSLGLIIRLSCLRWAMDLWLHNLREASRVPALGFLIFHKDRSVSLGAWALISLSSQIKRRLH